MGSADLKDVGADLLEEKGLDEGARFSCCKGVI